MVEIRALDTIHDSMEDAFAAREVVLWCLNNTAKLEEWATRKGNTISPKAVKRHTNKRKVKHNSSQRESKFDDDDDDDDDSDYDEGGEVLFWSDVAEDFGWPHPDTGYDPWSD
jgi:hypothetical protein